MAGNANLRAAKAAKNDEFYTQWNDIESEMQAYLEYNPDVFRGKTILLPCDDPDWSNFTKYFAERFEQLGMKKLISTSYAADGGDGKVFVLEGENEPQWGYLAGDGDFRSEEVTALRDEADMVITNPPFSLFREFMAWLAEGGVEFSAIGNMNAVACKEIFPLIKGNEMWLGASRMGAKYFALPSNAPVKSNQYEENGVRFQKFGNIAWFTNIEYGRRHEPLVLMSMEDNLLYGSKRVRGAGYPKYDNYDAIEVPETKAIPSDYDGVMGVPVSFLDKYSPEQFEIVGRSGDIEWAKNECVFFTPPAKEQQHKHRAANKTWRVQKAYVLNDEGLAQTIYQRIFIRHRNPEREESPPLSRPQSGRSSLGCKRELSHIL